MSSLSQPYPDHGETQDEPVGSSGPGQPEKTSRNRKASSKKAEGGSIPKTLESTAEEGAEAAESGAKWTLAFNTRMKNDEVTKLSAMLAYYFLMSIVPLLVVLLSFIGLVIGNLSPQAQHTMVGNLARSTPVSQDFISAALAKLSKSSGILAIAGILISIYTGTQLFLTIDYCFCKIYKVPMRRPLRRWLVALAMLAMLVIVVPLLLVVSSVPAVLSSDVVTRVFGHSAVNGVLVTLATVLFGLLVAIGLFLVVYTVIPNRRLGVRDSWQGALVAGALFTLYIFIFPFYASHLLGSGSLAASAGFALVALILLYYFGYILLIGAEMNAFLADRRRGGSGVPPPEVSEEK